MEERHTVALLGLRGRGHRLVPLAGPELTEEERGLVALSASAGGGYLVPALLRGLGPAPEGAADRGRGLGNLRDAERTFERAGAWQPDSLALDESGPQHSVVAWTRGGAPGLRTPLRASPEACARWLAEAGSLGDGSSVRSVQVADGPHRPGTAPLGNLTIALRAGVAPADILAGLAYGPGRDSTVLQVVRRGDGGWAVSVTVEGRVSEGAAQRIQEVLGYTGGDYLVLLDHWGRDTYPRAEREVVRKLIERENGTALLAYLVGRRRL